MKLKRAFLQFKVWVIRMYVHYFVQLDPKAKCPSCGIRQQHPIKYDTDSKFVLNWCRTLHADERQNFGCGAIWSTPCLVNPANWEAVIQTQEEEGQIKVGQPEQKFVGVTREPRREPILVERRDDQKVA